MKRYLMRRTLQTIVLIWIVITVLFFFFRAMPGDFADIIIFGGADPETVDAFRAKWGLDEPLYVQYWSYLQNMVTLDAGISFESRIPVWDHVKFGLFHSVILIAPAITTAYILGSLYGVLAGSSRGSFLERHGIVAIVAIGALPSFFLAILMVAIFGNWLDVFPSSGIVTAETRRAYRSDPWWRIYLTRDFLWHYLLPFTTIVLRYLYLPSLIMRTSVIEVQGQGFSYYHRLTGLPKTRRLRHIGKHASLPVITLYPVSMTRALGGLVLIEVVFSWPGIGATLVGAVFARDFPVLQFIFVLIAVFIILANFVVDIVYNLIDPRVSLE